MAIRAVLFDLDDTLWKVGPPPNDWAEVTALQAGEIGTEFERLQDGQLNAVDFVRRFWRNWADASAQPNPTFKELSGAEMMRDTLAYYGVKCSLDDGEHLWERIHNVPFSHFNITEFPDAARTVQALRTLGYRLAIVTNRPTPESTLRREIAAQGLPHVFDAIVTTGSVGYQKPHPLVFESAARLLGVRNGDAVVVGDSYENDIIPASGLGMLPILKLNDRPHDPACVLARHQVATLDALLQLDLFRR